MTGIEPAPSAWESVPSGPVTWPDLRGTLSESDREIPLFTEVNGPTILHMTRLPLQPPRNLDLVAAFILEPKVPAGGDMFR